MTADRLEFATDSLGVYLRVPGRTDGWSGADWFGPYSSRREALEADPEAWQEGDDDEA